MLVKYHGDGDPDALVANLELQEMQEVIELDGSDKRWWDFRELFNTREARYRTFLVTCIAWFGELDLPPTSYYFPLMGMFAYPAVVALTDMFNSQDSRHYQRFYTTPPQRYSDANHGNRGVLRNQHHAQVRQAKASHVL